MTAHPAAHSAVHARPGVSSPSLFLVFLASLPAVTTRVYSSDEIEYFSYLRSVWFDHDVSFENEYQYFTTGTSPAPKDSTRRSWSWRPRRAGGRTSAPSAARCCGVRSTPSADVTPACARAAGSDVAVDGFSRPYIAAVAYGSALYGFLAVLLTIGAARRLLAPGSRRPAPAGRTGLRAPTRHHDLVGESPGLGRLAAAVLHVRGAADVARLLGVRGRALRHGVAARAPGLDARAG